MKATVLESLIAEWTKIEVSNKITVPAISIEGSTPLGSAVAVQAVAAGTNMAPSLYESFVETGANRIGLFWQ